MKALLSLALLALLITYTMPCPRPEEELREVMGLFSWGRSVFADGGVELFDFMDAHGFTEVYQWFSSQLTDEQVTAFLRIAHARNIDVFLLTGDPYWARDPEGQRLILEINRAVRFNGLLPRRVQGIQGVVLNVEPHALREWRNGEDYQRALMANFVAQSQRAFDEAVRLGLEVILCIPNWYDAAGFDDELYALISTATHRVAVMNYARNREIARIRGEVALAQQYGRGIIQIYEFGPPGRGSITEAITYYYAGFEAALANFEELRAYFYDSGITMAAHHFYILRELLTSPATHSSQNPPAHPLQSAPVLAPPFSPHQKYAE